MSKYSALVDAKIENDKLNIYIDDEIMYKLIFDKEAMLNRLFHLLKEDTVRSFSEDDGGLLTVTSKDGRYYLDDSIYDNPLCLSEFEFVSICKYILCEYENYANSNRSELQAVDAGAFWVPYGLNDMIEKKIARYQYDG